MNYCEELHKRIREWRKALDELRNLIDGYSEEATEDLKKEIEKQILEVERLKDEYINYLKNECFKEVEIVDMNRQQIKVEIFAPEAQALKEIEAIIEPIKGMKPKVKVENRRITEFSVIWYDLPHNKLYPALEILFKHCKNLKLLDVSFNKLTSLPNLPKGLTELYCCANQLTSLPPLPKGLTELYCWGNFLTSLPDLPDNLTVLRCYSNRLSSLPDLPDTLKFINASKNPLTEKTIQKLREFMENHPNTTVYF